MDDDEEEIFEQFAHGDLKYLDAIERLQKIGIYSPLEAERLVSEWADSIEERSKGDGGFPW